jgi:hypothetical protein
VTVAAAPVCPRPDREDGADPDLTGRGN